MGVYRMDRNIEFTCDGFAAIGSCNHFNYLSFSNTEFDIFLHRYN